MSSTRNPAFEQFLPLALQAASHFEALDRGHSFLPRLVGAASLLAAGALAADDIMYRLKPGNSAPSFTVFPAEHGASQEVLTIFRSGFNSPPDDPANVYLPAVTQFGQMAVMRDAKTGHNIAKSNQAVAELCDKLQPKLVVLLGNSVGGMKHVPLARHLTQELQIDTRVAAFCSPLNFDHVKGTARRRMVKLLDVLGKSQVQGGDRARFFIETVGCLIEKPGGNKTLKQAIGHARRKANQVGVPTNGQVLHDAGFLHSYDCSPDLQALDPKIFSYIGPSEPSEDEVIDNPQAIAYAEKHLGGPIRYVTEPGLGHANTCVARAQSQRAVTQAYTRFGLKAAA